MDKSVETYVRQLNLDKFRKRIEATTDPLERKTLLTLLAEEEAKEALARAGKPA